MISRLLSSSRLPLDLVGWGTGDVEPLVDAAIDGCRCLVLTLGNVERAGIGAVGRVRDGGVGARASSV